MHSRGGKLRSGIVTLFIDRDIWSKALDGALHAAGIPFVPHREVFADDVPDEQWIAAVAEHGWVVVTRDKRIRYRCQRGGRGTARSAAHVCAHLRQPYGDRDCPHPCVRVAAHPGSGARHRATDDVVDHTSGGFAPDQALIALGRPVAGAGATCPAPTPRPAPRAACRRSAPTPAAAPWAGCRPGRSRCPARPSRTDRARLP